METQQHITQNTNSPSSWIEISQTAFFKNLAIIRQLAGNSAVGLVIKANAYGHGMLQVAQLAEQHKDVDYLCTFSLSEALELRTAGIKKPILALSFVDQPAELAIQQNIDLVISSTEDANRVNKAAAKLNCKAAVHIKIDTGLSRLGIDFDDADQLKQVANLPNLSITGAFTHFAESDNLGGNFTDLQISRFQSTIKTLEQLGCKPKFIHAQNSSATAHVQNPSYNFVRVGGLAYGLTKSKNIDAIIADKTGSVPEQIFSLKSKIFQIKKIKQGEHIGYSRTFKADKDLTVALLPIGYSDGYPRNLSNKGTAYINGQPANVVGRISMNMIAVDITGIQASIGDIAELVGNRPGIRIRDISQAANTIDYEICTHFSFKLPQQII